MTLFRGWLFAATGAPRKRTLPDRLAEEKNLLEFTGADPTGVADSTAALQACFDAAIAAGTGVFVPPGTYKISDSGTGSAGLWNRDADFGFSVRGVAGGGGTTITSNNCPGYLIDRALGTPNNTLGPRIFENIRFVNNTTSPSNGGCLRIGSSIGAIVRNCSFSSPGVNLTFEDAAGSSSQCINIDTCRFVSTPSNTTAIGLVMGGSGTMIGCDFNENATAAVVYGSGIALLANRCESSITAYKLGLDSAGTDRGLKGFSLISEECEGVTTVVDIMGLTTGFTIDAGCLGHDSSNSGGQGHQSNSQYGIRIRANKAYYGEIVNSSPGGYMDVGGIYMEDYAATGLGKRSFITFSNCSPTVGGGAGVPWRIPTASGWPQFVGCAGISANVVAPYGTRYHFANLPSGGDLLEGDEFDIDDGNSGTIGGNVTAGGGSNRVRVRWNSSNWVRTV